MEDLLIKTMTGGIILLDIVILSFFISFIFKSSNFYANFLKKYGIWVIFLISLVSTVGSLIISQVLKLPPCDLCWYQRIFMYPVVLITGFSLFKKDYKSAARYSLLLAIVGSVIALYHVLVQWSDTVKNSNVICGLNSIDTEYIDCSIPYFVEFGFVSIPFMSLSVFILIIISATYVTKGQKR